MRAAGASRLDDHSAGTDVGVEPTHVYRVAEARNFLAAEGVDAGTIATQVGGKFMSAFVRPTKPR